MGWYVPRPMEALLDTLAQWLREFPGLGMLLITCLPISLVIGSEWLDGRRRRATQAAAEPSPG